METDEAVGRFIESFLKEYEKKKKLVTFLVGAVRANPDLLKNKDFCKAVLVFAGKVTDVELDLMELDGVPTTQFYEIISSAEESLGVEVIELSEEDLENLGGEDVDVEELEKC